MFSSLRKESPSLENNAHTNLFFTGIKYTEIYKDLSIIVMYHQNAPHPTFLLRSTVPVSINYKGNKQPGKDMVYIFIYKYIYISTTVQIYDSVQAAIVSREA